MSDTSLMDLQLYLRHNIKVTSLTMNVSVTVEVCHPTGLCHMQPSCQPVVTAIEMNLGHSDGGYGHITEVAVLPVPQPQLGKVVRVDVLVKLRVSGQLPLHSTEVGPMSVSA